MKLNSLELFFKRTIDLKRFKSSGFSIFPERISRFPNANFSSCLDEYTMTLRQWPANPSKVSTRWTWHHPPPRTCTASTSHTLRSPAHHPVRCTVHTPWPLTPVLLMLSMSTSYPPSQFTLLPETWTTMSRTMAGNNEELVSAYVYWKSVFYRWSFSEVTFISSPLRFKNAWADTKNQEIIF